MDLASVQNGGLLEDELLALVVAEGFLSKQELEKYNAYAPDVYFM